MAVDARLHRKARAGVIEEVVVVAVLQRGNLARVDHRRFQFHNAGYLLAFRREEAAAQPLQQFVHAVDDAPLAALDGNRAGQRADGEAVLAKARVRRQEGVCRPAQGDLRPLMRR